MVGVEAEPVRVGAGATAGVLGPPLKWAGGKRWLVPRMAGLWRGQEGRRWVEPFVGGLALPLGLRPARALLNDHNAPLIAFYRWLQQGLVIEEPLLNDRTWYYVARARFNALLVSGQGKQAEAAGLFYYLNRTGFNGLCRFNRQGLFNVPFGRYATIRYTYDFSPYRTVLGGWTFQHGDFAGLALEPGDFVYADPPYDVPFTTYSPGGFSWADQVRLAEWLAGHPGPVVASNQATARILDLYRGLGFAVELLQAPRRISSSGDRTPAEEMVAVRGV